MSLSHDSARPATRLGATGLDVADIRSRLGQVGYELPPGDVFDVACERAIRQFQQQRGLRVDGRIGQETFRALDEARWHLGDRVLAYTVSHPLVGDDVAALQRRLSAMGFDCGKADGIFAARTETAVREFQRNVGLVVDGTCGPATFRALQLLARTVVGGQPNALREYERLHRAGPTLAGKLVIIDPAHGGTDRGTVGGHGADGEPLDEAQLVDDLANLIEGKLAAAGAQAFRTRATDMNDAPDELLEPLGEADRAAFANGAEADLLISLHIDGDRDPNCHGVATFYYGSAEGEHSAVGRRFAELVQDEIVAQTDLLDCRIHPKTYALLRATRMPAIRIDLGYLTNAADALRLASAPFRDRVAEAVVAGIQRLYEPVQLADERNRVVGLDAAWTRASV